MDQDEVIELLELAKITPNQAKRMLDGSYDREWGYNLPSKLRRYLEKLSHSAP